MPPDTYHHGDLPNALRAAAAGLLAEEGVAGFSLREVARRAEVSHAAPAHHFGDASGLLTAVAVEGFEVLAERTTEAVEGIDDPVEALVRVGRAYVSVAVDHPGHCAVLFRKDAVHADDPSYRAAGDAAFAVLYGTLERLAAEQAPDLDPMLASQLCWSAMQGLVSLHPTMVQLGANHGLEVATIGDLAEAFTRQLISGLVPAAPA